MFLMLLVDDHKGLVIIISKNTSQHCKIFRVSPTKSYTCITPFSTTSFIFSAYPPFHLHFMIIATSANHISQHSPLHKSYRQHTQASHSILLPLIIIISKLSKVVSYSIIHTGNTISPLTHTTSTTDSLTPSNTNLTAPEK